MTDVWNNVTIYGPRADIQRFRKACIDPEQQVYRSVQSGWDGCNRIISLPPSNEAAGERSPISDYGEHVWNFQQFTSQSSAE